MIVYDYFRSSASFRLRIALNLKGLSPELRNIHLGKGEQKSAEYKAINPQGLVPYLIDGDFRLSQSLAIIEYLDDKYPQPPLMPTNIEECALARQIAQTIACDIHPLNNSRVLAYLSDKLEVSDAVKATWYCGWIHDGFTAIEAQLQARPVQTKFCIGDTPTLADICLIPQVTNANRFSCSLEKFPTIMNIYHHAMQMPEFALAHPSKQAAE